MQRQSWLMRVLSELGGHALWDLSKAAVVASIRGGWTQYSFVATVVFGFWKWQYIALVGATAAGVFIRFLRKKWGHGRLSLGQTSANTVDGVPVTTIQVANRENKVPTTCHDVTADLTLKNYNGEVLKAKGCFILDGRRETSFCIDLGMCDIVPLGLVGRYNGAFYIFTGLPFEPTHKLAFGLWEIEIRINSREKDRAVKKVFLQLNPKESVGSA